MVYHEIKSTLLLMLAGSLLCLPCTADILIGHNCSKGNYTSDSTYKYNLDNLLGDLKVKSSTNSFYEDVEDTGNNQTVYGSYICQSDLLPQHNCSTCVLNAIQGILKNCSSQTKAQIWYDECLLQYSDEPYFGTWIQDYMVWCSTHLFQRTQVAKLDNVLNQTLTEVAHQAAGDQRRFATREVNLTFNGSSTMFTLAQCMPDLSPDLCYQCLNEGFNKQIPAWCSGTMGGRAICSSCFIRYEMYRFYATEIPASAPAPPPFAPLISSPPKGAPNIPPTEPVHSGKRISLILAIVGITTSVVILLTLGMWFYLRNRKALNDFEANDMAEITSAESLQMDFNKVRIATQNFAPDGKLGEGGFGDVYKGKLENGQDIAVKRLTSSSGQGAAEFKNEVILVAKLQHRNLVKLLGFCMSGKEKILVYEYLPNSSLDKVLFDPIKRASLNWETRFNIICGIAKGLLYLHEDSRLRIIHRDLKSSNILLDEAMNPKISDFGIAKTLALDQTRALTDTVAGTYGYMAPEYLLTGQYSLKSDMYSFGIIVLEIVSSQRNRFCDRPLLEEALLHRAWRLWNKDAELEMVDSTLNDAYSMEEVVKCIHIGLLCIQEDAGRRPKMASVVASLSGKSVDLPAPTPPNFFNINSSISTAAASTSATITTTNTAGTMHSELLPYPADD